MTVYRQSSIMDALSSENDVCFPEISSFSYFLKNIYYVHNLIMVKRCFGTFKDVDILKKIWMIENKFFIISLSSTSPPGVNLVDGLPPVLNAEWCWSHFSSVSFCIWISFSIIPLFFFLDAILHCLVLDIAFSERILYSKDLHEFLQFGWNLKKMQTNKIFSAIDFMIN